jgi:hypothetical protein
VGLITETQSPWGAPSGEVIGLSCVQSFGLFSSTDIQICTKRTKVEVSATGWSLVRRSPTERGVSISVIVKRRKMTRPRPLGAVEP